MGETLFVFFVILLIIQHREASREYITLSNIGALPVGINICRAQHSNKKLLTKTFGALRIKLVLSWYIPFLWICLTDVNILCSLYMRIR